MDYELDCLFCGLREFDNKEKTKKFRLASFSADGIGSFECFIDDERLLQVAQLSFGSVCQVKFEPIVDSNHRLGLRFAGIR